MARPAAVGAALLLTGAVLFGAGCAQPGRVPVTERSPLPSPASAAYRVQPGDTLYSIAWRLGVDYRALAGANGIAAPYTIYVGQSIRLDTAATADSPANVSRPSAQRPVVATHAGPGTGWRRPTNAPVGRGYGAGNKGIDYRLGSDHRVRAAAAGEVVYAGSGLRGFRHLVIVKHSPSYLSAYSLDPPVVVHEGQRVKAGEPIADISVGGRRNGTLHFEIRRNGEPVDPASLISR